MYGYHRDLHVLTHSFPTRRSSDLRRRSNHPRRDPVFPRNKKVVTSHPNHIPTIMKVYIIACPDRTDYFSLATKVAECVSVDYPWALVMRPPRWRYWRWPAANKKNPNRSEEHTSELQSLMRISYAVFCLKKKKISMNTPHH